MTTSTSHLSLLDNGKEAEEHSGSESDEIESSKGGQAASVDFTLVDEEAPNRSQRPQGWSKTSVDDLVKQKSVDGLKDQLRCLMSMHPTLNMDFRQGAAGTIEDLDQDELLLLKGHLLAQLTNTIDGGFTAGCLDILVRALPGVDVDELARNVNSNQSLQLAFRTIVGWQLNKFGPGAKTLFLLGLEYMKSIGKTVLRPQPVRRDIEELIQPSNGNDEKSARWAYGDAVADKYIANKRKLVEDNQSSTVFKRMAVETSTSVVVPPHMSAPVQTEQAIECEGDFMDVPL